MSLIIRAAALATRAHEGQFRKNSSFPYITHPARVAGLVGILPGATEEMVAAAYLHDVIEDTAVSKDEIERETNAQVAFYVDCMTNRSKGGQLSREQRKKMDRERLATIPVEVKKIKLLDRIDNLREMTDYTSGFKALYASESLLLLEAIGDGDPDLAKMLQGIAERMRAEEAGMQG